MGSKAVRDGKLLKAIRQINPKKKGPWTVLCDNESFLRSKVVAKAHQKIGVKLWKIPAKSPDLNPIERARGLARLRDTFGLTQKALSERVGLDRSTVANLLRVLELDDFSLAAVRRGTLSCSSHSRYSSPVSLSIPFSSVSPSGS